MNTASASGIACAHLPRPLDLDLEHHRNALRKPPVELGAQRPVAAPE